MKPTKTLKESIPCYENIKKLFVQTKQKQPAEASCLGPKKANSYSITEPRALYFTPFLMIIS